MNPRLLLPLLAAGLGAALIYPWLVPNYLVTVGMLMFFSAFIGQSWNISGGFAGQTSFGHAVFFGVGAYTSTILQVSHGWNPWIAWIAVRALSTSRAFSGLCSFITLRTLSTLSTLRVLST